MYLEGMEEASIFVHVAVNDITSKVSTSCGLQAKKHVGAIVGVPRAVSGIVKVKKIIFLSCAKRL